MLNSLPDELLTHLFKFTVSDIKQLIQLGQVSKRFYRLIFMENPKLWYLTFKYKYPIWSHNVNYSLPSKHLVDWKEYCIHSNIRRFSLEFVPEQPQSRKRKRILHIEQPPFCIQDPLVIDIDRITNTGVVATGKHRRNIGYPARSEHQILFWAYPSWKLIRVFELNLQPRTLTCQIISIQSVRMIAQDGTTAYKARFFSLAVGVALINGIDTDINEDRADIWKSLFIYRLFKDGSTQCMAHIKINDLFLGRDVFLFSDTSWCQPNDGDTFDHTSMDWMKVTLPEHQQDYDSYHTVFVVAMGPIYHHITGCMQLAKFDIRGTHNILDPSIITVIWDNHSLQLVSRSESRSLSYYKYVSMYAPPSETIATIQLGSDMSCMIHFKYPPQLNHLVCTGSSQDDELSIYDWRFGVKVGSLPWKHNRDVSIQVQPWGLESTLILPSCHDHGFRLIAVGDNRGETEDAKFQIKIWDISHLLHAQWDPLLDDTALILLSPNVQAYLATRFHWWPRRTSALTRMALHMVQSDSKQVMDRLPYSLPQEKKVLLSHTFEKNIKYTAYNVLNTSLLLLTEDGQVTVLDIETGQMSGKVESVAEHTHIKGIDISVIGGQEVVVTCKEGILRGTIF